MIGFPDFEYTVILNKIAGSTDRIMWLRSNVGQIYKKWSYNVNYYNDTTTITYSFVKEEHAILFALRWA